MGRGKCDPPYYEEGEDEWLEQRLQQLQRPQRRPGPRCVTLRRFCIGCTCFNIFMNVALIGLGVFFIVAPESDANKKFKKLEKNEQTPEKRKKLVNDIRTMGIATVVYLVLALLVLVPVFVLLKKKDEQLLKYHSRNDLSLLIVGLILSILFFFIIHPDAIADTKNGNILLFFAFTNMIFYRAVGICFMERYRHELLLPEVQVVGLGNVDGLILIGLMAEDGARAAANVQAEVAPAIINTAAPEEDQNNTNSLLSWRVHSTGISIQRFLSYTRSGGLEFFACE